MSRTIAGTLLLPDGTAMAGAIIYFAAKRVESANILPGSSTSFTTDGTGAYTKDIEPGYYAVSLSYNPGFEAGRRWDLGDVIVETSATAITLNALLQLDQDLENVTLETFTQILADAQTARDEAEAAATAAALSESNAATSEAAAASSASAASVSETNAAASAATVASIYDSFDDRYLGAFATAPTVDNDGNALEVGALYFDTVVNHMLTWTGATWRDDVALAEAERIAAEAARAGAESAETNAATSASNAATSEANAKTSETNASTSETNAANSASAASTSETNAAASETAAGVSETNAANSATAAGISETNAATSETNAAGSATAANNAQSYATEWANKAEDSLISVAAGGDNVDDYSAKHHAAKAAASAASIGDAETNSAASAAAAATSETNAAASEAKAEQWADEDEDVEVETGLYSAKHHAAKASASATAAETAEAGASATGLSTSLASIVPSDTDQITTADTLQTAIEKTSAKFTLAGIGEEIPYYDGSVAIDLNDFVTPGNRFAIPFATTNITNHPLTNKRSIGDKGNSYIVIEVIKVQEWTESKAVYNPVMQIATFSSGDKLMRSQNTSNIFSPEWEAIKPTDSYGVSMVSTVNLSAGTEVLGGTLKRWLQGETVYCTGSIELDALNGEEVLHGGGVIFAPVAGGTGSMGPVETSAFVLVPTFAANIVNPRLIIKTDGTASVMSDGATTPGVYFFSGRFLRV